MVKEANSRRKKGEGSIRKKENGTYLGRITISGYEPFSCTGSSRKEVEKKLAEFRLRAMRKEVIADRIVVNAYIEKWLENVKKPSLKSSSYDRLERTYINQIRDTPVGRCQLGTVTAMDLQRLINRYSQDFSYSTVKKVYELLHCCFQYAVLNREMPFNPMEVVAMPKKENMAKATKEIRIFSQEELKKIEALVSIVYGSGRPRYKYAYFFIFLANTGLRAGEALALTWEDVDFETRMIAINKSVATIRNRATEENEKYKVIVTSVETKNGNRFIPLNDKAMKALLWLKRYQSDNGIKTQQIICTDKGNRISQKTLPHLLSTVLDAAGVPYRNVHAFRHTFASHLIDAGVDVKVVSQLLGHSSVKVTYDTYVHVGNERAIEAVKSLDE